MVLFGLKSCDTCRKALAALRSAGHEVAFRDIRESPLSPADRAAFIAAFGPALINRSSTTWRGLSEADRHVAPDDLLARHPAVMKRPVIRTDDALHLGWTEAVRMALLT